MKLKNFLKKHKSQILKTLLLIGILATIGVCGYLTRYWWGWIILVVGIIALGLITWLFYKLQKKGAKIMTENVLNALKKKCKRKALVLYYSGENKIYIHDYKGKLNWRTLQKSIVDTLRENNFEPILVGCEHNWYVNTTRVEDTYIIHIKEEK